MPHVLFFFWYDRCLFGPKGDEVTGDWRKLHNGALHNLYSSPNVIRMIKSRRMVSIYSMSGGEEDFIQDIGGKDRKKETTRKIKT
jgi:hypothetical protein